MFGDALSTPAKTSDAAITVFIGGVLTLLATVGSLGVVIALPATPLALLGVPVVLLPILVLRGYYVAVIADGANREPGAPSIVRWGTLLSDGVKSAVVSAGYLLPAVLVVGLALGALVALVPPGAADPTVSPPSAATVDSSIGDARALGVLAVLGLGSLFLLAYALLYAYLRPAALSVFAVSGSLREAFRPGRVRAVAGTGDYAVGWLLAVLVLVVAGAFALPLAVLLVGFFLFFYLRVVAHSLYGRAASGVLVPETVSPDESPEERAARDDDRADGTDADGDVRDSEDDGLPSEWATESDTPDPTGDGLGADPRAPDRSLSDWDDASDAVESSAVGDADSGRAASAGGVPPAVQSGRGVPMDGTGDRNTDAVDSAADDPNADATRDAGPQPGDVDAGGTAGAAPGEPDPDGTEDDPFDWGPVEDR
jgi:hypothetical protein